MNSPKEIFEVTSTYWLAVFAASLLVSVAYLWRLALSKSDGAKISRRMTAAGAALILCLTAVDGLNFVQQDLGVRYRLIGTIAVIAATAGLTWLHLSQWKTPRYVLRRRPQGWLLLISSMCLVSWSYHRFYQRLYPASGRPQLVLHTPGKKQQVHEFVALTDRNRPIHVFRLDENPELSVGAPEDNWITVDYLESAIQRAPASPLANCHGWVFLDGQFLISGEAVQQILDDNGYELMDEPRAGDVVVYRGDNREIIHTGLVRGVLNDGTIIIESKWGTEGCFLHSPEGQPYSQDFEYYRSTRMDNRLKIVPVDELPMDE